MQRSRDRVDPSVCPERVGVFRLEDAAPPGGIAVERGLMCAMNLAGGSADEPNELNGEREYGVLILL